MAYQNKVGAAIRGADLVFAVLVLPAAASVQ